MALRMRNALRMGEDVAAQIPASRPEGAAWVWVRPVMKAGKTYQEVLANWTRRHQASEGYDDTIAKFFVRYLELSLWSEAELEEYEPDSLRRTRTLSDTWTEIEDEAQLEACLLTYLQDLTQLRHPHSVNYYFSLGRRL